MAFRSGYQEGRLPHHPHKSAARGKGCKIFDQPVHELIPISKVHVLFLSRVRLAIKSHIGGICKMFLFCFIARVPILT